MNAVSKSRVKEAVSKYYIHYKYIQVDSDMENVVVIRRKLIGKKFNLFPIYEEHEETIIFAQGYNLYESYWGMNLSCSTIEIAIDKINKIIYWKQTE